VNPIVEWLGTATFRLTIGDLVVFLDTYVDRVPAAPPVGLSAADVARADYILIGHSHFDHLGGADVVAKNTGARIIGSNETCRVMRERGVPEAQLLASQGGERHGLASGITARVFPSVHSCTWILTDAPAGVDEHGHTGLTQEERASQPGLTQRIMGLAGTPEGAEIFKHIGSCAGSLSDGGPLVYLIETPEGSVFWQDTSGCWTGILRELRADVAILAAAGRANVDGEPVQGSMAGFIAMEAAMLQARTVLIGHHDDWMPPVTSADFDMAAVRAQLASEASAATLLEPAYLETVSIL
jgi:L-ascorbate metabolism protein UlaG (beta-lactamase superfamily)